MFEILVFLTGMAVLFSGLVTGWCSTVDPGLFRVWIISGVALSAIGVILLLVRERERGK